MGARPIEHFEPDAERFAVIAECTRDYDVAKDAKAEWPNNMISRRAVVYGSGVIARRGEKVRHFVDPGELARCRRFSTAAAKRMKGVPVGMGSESGDGFRDFYVVANADEQPAAAIDAALVRKSFGGTLFPLVTIAVEPLATGGTWWSEVMEDGENDEEYLLPWRQMVRWFEEQPDLVDRAFVRIGDSDALMKLERSNALPQGTQLMPCVLPRLALGLTTHGSLVGLFGYSVQS